MSYILYLYKVLNSIKYNLIINNIILMLNPKYYKVPKVTTKRNKTSIIQPEWNKEITDLTKYRLSNQDLIKKKVLLTSKNLEYIRNEGVVESKQKEIEKRIREYSTKGNNSSMNFESKTSFMSLSILNIKELNEYVNKYRIDSNMPLKKLSINQTFSKSKTGRNEIKPNKSNLNSSFQSDYSYNIRHNERNRRFEYGRSLIERKGNMSLSDNEELKNIDGDNNSLFNGKISKISKISNKRNSTQENSGIIINTRSSSLNSQDNKNKKRKNYNDELNAKITMQKNCIVTKTKVKRKNMIDNHRCERRENKENFRRNEEVNEKTDNDLCFEDEQSFEVKKEEVKESLYDCIEKLNKVMKKTKMNNEDEGNSNNEGGIYKTKSRDYWNKDFNEENLYDISTYSNNIIDEISNPYINNIKQLNNINDREYQEEEYDEYDDSYIKVKNQVADDLNKYSFLINSQHEAETVKDNVFTFSNRKGKDEYEYRLSDEKEKSNSKEVSFSEYNYNDSMNANPIKVKSNINYNEDKKDKIDIKNISYLKNILKATNDNIRQINEKFKCN